MNDKKQETRLEGSEPSVSLFTNKTNAYKHAVELTFTFLAEELVYKGKGKEDRTTSFLFVCFAPD